MGKNKKKRKQASSDNASAQAAASTGASKTSKSNLNPLQTAQQSFLKSLPSEARTHFFSCKHITPDQRAEIWENQADLGEKLVNKYAWATPDARALKVLQHFAPIVEVGSGSNAYWAKWMHDEGNVDVIAFDVSLESGGKINVKDGKKKKKGEQDKLMKDGFAVRQGGPSVLSSDPDVQDRTLFLCYPDEEEYQASDSEDDEDSYNGRDINDSKPKSMAAACLEHFTGSTIIHVGELFGDTLGLDHSPWGRSSSTEFQERLAAEYHCILKMKLQNNWLHVRDTLSVWKRSETCAMVYENDSEDEDGSAEEDHYKCIPPEEQLTMDVAAPCVAHLLSSSETINRKSSESATTEGETNLTEAIKPQSAKKKRKKKEADEQVNKQQNSNSVIAGSAWQ